MTVAADRGVSKSEAKAVLERMKRGGATTMSMEAEALGLPSVGPLKAALIRLCGGEAGYKEMMGERRYPRKTKQARRRKRGAVVAEAGEKVKGKKVVAAATKKKEAGRVAVEFDEGGSTDDDDDGGGVVLGT